ncbi:MAG: hypothetical protein EBZ77_16590 [Chitinophagia bacterium]|nr:hypothetical protein [Chitinophagia bacterium]
MGGRESAGGCCTHQKPLGRNKLAAMLGAVFAGPPERGRLGERALPAALTLLTTFPDGKYTRVTPAQGLVCKSKHDCSDTFLREKYFSRFFLAFLGVQRGSEPPDRPPPRGLSPRKSIRNIRSDEWGAPTHKKELVQALCDCVYFMLGKVVRSIKPLFWARGAKKESEQATVMQ